jgi:hypothetical protein
MGRTWERQETCTKFWSQNLKGKDHLVELGVAGRIILRWMLMKQGVRVWIEIFWLSIGTGVGFLCEHLQVSYKTGNFLTS